MKLVIRFEIVIQTFCDDHKALFLSQTILITVVDCKWMDCTLIANRVFRLNFILDLKIKFRKKKKNVNTVGRRQSDFFDRQFSYLNNGSVVF